MLDPEALLLVDDDQPEVLERDALAEQPMGSNDHVDRAIREARNGLFRFFVGLEPAERPQMHREPGETFGEGFDVLPHQQGGRHNHRHLFAILHCLEGGTNGNLRLAVTNVT